MLRAAVEGRPTRLVFVTWLKAEFRSDHNLIAKWFKRLTDKFLICKWSVDLSRVEECDALLDRRTYYSNHLFLVTCRPVAKAHAHAAQPDRRYFQSAIA